MVYNFIYNIMVIYEDVDIIMLRRVLFNYVYCMFGIRYVYCGDSFIYFQMKFSILVLFLFYLGVYSFGEKILYVDF